ncbi:hypothetical protein MTR67_012987 [Solanum verrucosum]|uniref:Uncharacterized protein n=1 Tax=Solanum verrucosum TaxID=315347 RepID=A0AAF0Q9Q7_SOLVR|nr:hypothetical protein MTR67_012987 [Solanum verrucosum]
MTGNDRVELESYQLKYIAHIWFTQWKENRGMNAVSITWECFSETFLDRLSMGSVAHVEEERKEQAKDVHQLTRLGVRLLSISDGGVTVQNRSESSSVVEVKEKQDSDPIFLQLKGAVHQQRVEVIS